MLTHSFDYVIAQEGSVLLSTSSLSNWPRLVRGLFFDAGPRWPSTGHKLGRFATNHIDDDVDLAKVRSTSRASSAGR